MNLSAKKKGFFEGWYFKHQSNDSMLSVIPGVSNDKAFIQIITEDGSFNVDFTKDEFEKGRSIRVGENCFSARGIKLNIDSPAIRAKGLIRYTGLTPLDKDIMGFFRHFKMQCRHGVVSMYHNLDGCMEINDKVLNFSNGVGYIEKDSGCSFPRKYCWIHGNSSNEKCSVMLSIADVPFMGFYFKGIICSVLYKNDEYIIATYTGARELMCTKNKIIIGDRKYTLEVDIPKYEGNKLYAPNKGYMSNVIKETLKCDARFRFFYKSKEIFDIYSSHTSCEFV